MDRHFVGGEVVIHEKPDPLVDREFLHERRTETHRHGADHLTAGCLWVENAAARADREHSSHPRLPGGGVDPHLDEMRAERGLMKAFIQIAILDVIFRNEALLAGYVGQRLGALSEPDLAFSEGTV